MTKYLGSAVWLPTSVLFLDDDASFLSSLPFTITEAYPCLRHTSPEQALKVLNQSEAAAETLFKGDMDLEVWFGSCARFETVSVVVVDFEMPTMRGLEFCRQIDHLPVKRIMLTGTMDKGAAVEAFNEGLIHRYLRKDEPDAIAKLQRYIFELQQVYLLERTQRPELRRWSGGGAAEWCGDATLMAAIHRLLREQDFVEYVCIPGGLVVADRAGSLALLLVRTGEEMNAQLKRLSVAVELSPTVLDCLKRRERIYFDPAKNDLFSVDADPQALAGKLYTASAVLGTLDNYSVALLDNYAPINIEACGLDDALECLEPGAR